MWFLSFSNHEKGALRQEILKWSVVCSTLLRSGWSIAKGGTSKKRLSPHPHKVPTQSNKSMNFPNGPCILGSDSDLTDKESVTSNDDRAENKDDNGNLYKGCSYFYIIPIVWKEMMLSTSHRFECTRSFHTSSITVIKLLMEET
jgi:hypothetical protein